jgi:Uma2 family endonuclease
MLCSVAMAPTDPVRRAATYDDLRALPDHVVGEILDGELHVSPRPAPRHALTSSVLGGELGPPFHGGRGGPGGWWILDEPELHLERDVVVPDLAGWRRERMPKLPEEAFFSIAPDWVCEVLSPKTARIDRLKKLRIYAREHVRHAWLVDPIEQTLEVLRLDQERWTIVTAAGGAEVVRAEPFEAIELELARLWADGAATDSVEP